MDDNATLAVVVSKLQGLSDTFDQERRERREDFDKLREELRQFHGDKVSYDQWAQRNREVDGRFVDVQKDISRIEQNEAAKRSPIAVWISLAVSAASLILAGLVAFGSGASVLPSPPASESAPYVVNA